MHIKDALFRAWTEFDEIWCFTEPQLTDYNFFLVRCYAFYRISAKRGAEKNAEIRPVAEETPHSCRLFMARQPVKGHRLCQKVCSCALRAKSGFFHRADSQSRI